MSIDYQGKSISVYQLAKETGYPQTSLYRAYRKGFRSGEAILSEARKHLINYKGRYLTLKALCDEKNVSYGWVNRRLKAGEPIEKAILYRRDYRGVAASVKLLPSEVLRIYTLLFTKQACQTTLAEEYGVHQSTISDIWRHKRWGWLTSPLRYDLEALGYKRA